MNLRLKPSIAALTCCLLVNLVSAQTTQESSRFLRFVPDDNNGGVLEASVVTYRNAAGQTVDLIAAVHVADKSFYRDLNKSFEQYDALLYEMVKPKDMSPAERTSRGPAGLKDLSRPMGWVGVLQQFMKNTLELSFQLEEIDYSKPNFVHADLDLETFQKMQADRGESILMLMFQQIIREMTREQQPGMAEPDGFTLLYALQAPDRGRQLKLVIGRQFNQMEDMMADLGGPGGTVLLTERNRAALATLRKRLDAGDKKVGIFYGAGHLKEMEKDLIGLMGFKQVGEPHWRVAWDMRIKSPATQPTTSPMR
ncbi:MAG TPA: hypothetical protein VHD56_08525 [Tepidisphaeraceae bacterium]|nr:hypothetical protein [Tepidisphaeraceae bacterium]